MLKQSVGNIYRPGAQWVKRQFRDVLRKKKTYFDQHYYWFEASTCYHNYLQ